MKSIYQKIFFVSVTIAVILTDSLSQNQKREYSSLLNLRWEVSSVKEIYLPFEPIQIKFKLLNTTNLPTNRQGDIVSFDLYISHNGKTAKFMQLADHSNDYLNVPMIKPNESVELYRLQDYNFARMFPEYGKYDLTFVIPYDGSNGKIMEFPTNSFSINIVEPLGIDKEAFDFLNKYEHTTLLSGIVKENNREYLQRMFVDRFGQSVYGEYAIENLAYLYYTQGDIDKAGVEYEKLKFSKNPVISKRANLEISRIKRNKEFREKMNQQRRP